MPTSDLQTWGGQAVAFGPFRLYPEQGVLLRADKPLLLGSRAREILLVLVERAGEIVKKSELIARVWPDSIVEEGTLRVHIATLRKALRDGQGGMRYVENVTGHGYRFVAPLRWIDAAQPRPVPQPAAEPDSVPIPLTRMIGRAPVVATLASRVPQRRFVTIVGPGGIGKTTVAMATADHLRASYPHGVYFIDLASIADPLLISATIASALGLATVSQDPLLSVIEFLKGKQMLITLDNCEHVIEAAAVVAEKLLRGASGVNVIATSREPLRAKGEWVLRLAPLELPPAGAALSADDALGFSAIQLFTERAMASLHTFELSDADVPTVADICHKLDGLPLAIELAAARVELFGIRGLAARLDDRLGLLTRGCRTAMPRQQTLRATLNWSYELLSRAEQIALRRLAVFAGVFDMQSASAMIADNEVHAANVLDVLTSLAAKSLVAALLAGEQVCYRLLNTSRVYALEKLEESHERDEIKRRHALLCCSWGKDDPDWELQGVREKIAGICAVGRQRVDDVRAALDWCFSPEGDSSLGVNLTADSASIWFQSSFLNEYRGHVERALRFVKSTGISDAALELQLNAALGRVSLYAMDSSSTVTVAFDRTLELAERLGATVHRRGALWGLWVARSCAADYDSALGYAEGFRLMANNPGDPGPRLVGERMMAIAHHHLGNQITARHHVERALAGSVAPSSDYSYLHDNRAAARAYLARILWIQGFPDQAICASLESLEDAQSTGHSLSLCLALMCSCAVVLWTGDLPEATRLVAMLRHHSSQHSLPFFQFWGRCFELALARRYGEKRAGWPVLRDPMCTPIYRETLASLDEGLATDEALVRAENGLAGWCAAELLRVKAQTLLRKTKAEEEGDGAAEGLLLRSLDIAREQGALSWELRTAMSLARLWHSQHRTQEARDLLGSVHARFTEGFGTTDLVNAGTLLKDLSVSRRTSRLRTPAHDGRDSGVMADTLPTA
jgi:predicted ATPase/DNA-binding winged helix-turn-helix (wHTH) protein